MYRVVYVSSASRPMGSAELTELARRWQNRNAAIGITGVCLYIGGNFMQAFEGEDSKARDLYSTIIADARHRNVTTILSEEESPQRLFGDWSLDFREAADIPADQLSSLKSFINQAMAAKQQNHGPLALSLLIDFVKCMHKN